MHVMMNFNVVHARLILRKTRKKTRKRKP